MGWGNRWPEKQPRPKVQQLSEEQKNRILALMTAAINESPVMTALGVRVRFLRGRFYVESLRPVLHKSSSGDAVARLTPIGDSKVTLLLEKEGAKGNWVEIGRGSAGKLSRIIVEDPKRTFHGLGPLDRSIRQAREKGLDRLQLMKKGRLGFGYAKSGAECTVQEILFHYFGMPVEVIAEPREWYAYKREPKIVEISKDRKAVLVRFSSYNISFGVDFSGSCLYAVVNNRWQAFTIKPNQSESIARAVAWLEKRQWQGW
jgi:hypothetical protein